MAKPKPKLGFRLITNLNTRTADDGCTAFMLAYEEGHQEVVKLLVCHSSSEGIDLNARDNDGNTGFMRACLNECNDVVKLLLEYSEVG